MPYVCVASHSPFLLKVLGVLGVLNSNQIVHISPTTGLHTYSPRGNRDRCRTAHIAVVRAQHMSHRLSRTPQTSIDLWTSP